MNFTPKLINEMAAAQQDYMVSIRRHLHVNPELSGKEFNTSKLVEEELTKLGIPYIKASATGIIATLKGAKEGKTIVLRADMDALPMEEDQNNLSGKKVCCSAVPNVTHTCGHDAHTAMLLGTARALSAVKDSLEGTVIFCFEDGEEICIGNNYNIHQGAGAIIHALKDTKIDSCYAIHVYVGLPSGKICVDAGPRMAGISDFEVEFTGKGGHGSRPDQAISPIFAAAYTLTNLANSWVNEIDVAKTVTLGVGFLNGGQKFNIIPETARFGGSMRFFDLEEGKKAAKALERIIRLSAEMHRCTITHFDLGFMSSCINDSHYAEKAQKAIGAVLGEDAVVHNEPWFGSESFSFYLKTWPGVLAHLGISNPEKGIGALHHNPKFDVDEDVMPLGVASFIAYTLEVLHG